MLPEIETIRSIESVDRYPSNTYKLNPDTKHIAGYIDELEAVRQSIYLTLQTERFAWLIYNWYYGVEYDTLIGKNRDYVISEFQRRTKEALLEDDRIESVTDFKLSVTDDVLTAYFEVTTIYGKTDYRTEVMI